MYIIQQLDLVFVTKFLIPSHFRADQHFLLRYLHFSLSSRMKSTNIVSTYLANYMPVYSMPKVGGCTRSPFPCCPTVKHTLYQERTFAGIRKLSRLFPRILQS